MQIFFAQMQNSKCLLFVVIILAVILYVSAKISDVDLENEGKQSLKWTGVRLQDLFKLLKTNSNMQPVGDPGRTTHSC